jgi:hypothetical protein
MVGVTSDWRTAEQDWETNNAHAGIGVLEVQRSLEWKNSTGYPSIFQIPQRMQTFERIDKSKCIDYFISPLNTTRELVLVLDRTSSESNASGSSLLLGDLRVFSTDNFRRAPNWICYVAKAKRVTSRQEDFPCTREWANEFQDTWQVRTPYIPLRDQGVFPIFNVSHCLVGEAADQSTRCSLLFDHDLLIFSVVCIMLQFGTVLIIVLFYRTGALVHWGDLVAECLRGKILPAVELEKSDKRWSKRSTVRKGTAIWPNKRSSWIHAVPVGHWIFFATT